MLVIKILNIIIPTFLGGLCLVKRQANNPILSLASIYFIFTGLGELSGYLIGVWGSEKANVYFYNIFIPTSYVMRFLFFYFILDKKTHKQLSLVLAVIYIILLVSEQYSYTYKPLELHFLSYCFAATAVIAVSMVYLGATIQSNAILNFREDIIFWFCVATITFQLFTFPFYALFDAWYVYRKIGNVYWAFTVLCIYVSYYFYFKGIQCQLNKK